MHFSENLSYPLYQYKTDTRRKARDCQLTVEHMNERCQKEITQGVLRSKCKMSCQMAMFILRKEMFYLTTHSTHFYLRLYGVRHMVKDHSDSEIYTVVVLGQDI